MIVFDELKSKNSRTADDNSPYADINGCVAEQHVKLRNRGDLFGDFALGDLFTVFFNVSVPKSDEFETVVRAVPPLRGLPKRRGEFRRGETIV